MRRPSDDGPRFGLAGYVVRRHRVLLATAAFTTGFSAVWLYVRNHHVAVGSGSSRVDCGSWSDRMYADSRCLFAFGEVHDLAYLGSTIAAAMAAVYFVLVLARTVWRPPVYARRNNVMLRAVGPGDARALAATIDADVIVENRMPFNSPRTLRRVARWCAVPSHVAICNADTGRIVGAIVLTADLEAMEARLGIWIGPEHRGKGLATDALAAYAPTLHARGFSRVVVETSVDNRAMRAALENAGFECTGNFTFTFHNGESTRAARYVSLGESDQGTSTAGQAMS